MFSDLNLNRVKFTISGTVTPKIGMGYSAAFNVETHDDVEALLEQLPGVEIEEDGSIKVPKALQKYLDKEFIGK